MKRILLIFLVIIASVFYVNAQTIEGTWKTIDDETGKVKSEVKIVIKDGKAYGKIVKLFREKDEEQDPLCTKGNDYRNGKKIIGMVIITGLTKDSDEWKGDDGIFDPDNGKTYDCKIWLNEEDENILEVRGYIGFFFRTQKWMRVN
jgi:uncharacterized protein (DUF2147 family)